MYSLLVFHAHFTVLCDLKKIGLPLYVLNDQNNEIFMKTCRIVHWPEDVKNEWQFDRHFNITDTIIELNSPFGEYEIGANLIPKCTDRRSYFRRGEEFKNLKKTQSKSGLHGKVAR